MNGNESRFFLANILLIITSDERSTFNVFNQEITNTRL